VNIGNDAAGRTIAGKYQLVSPVGRGGMAVVWRAEAIMAQGFRRPVAVKRIEPMLRGSPEVVAMFVEEARVGSLLRHPNIVSVLDFGVDESGDYYLVTELVEGLHLGNWVNAHVAAKIETPWELVAAIGMEILRALDAAHNRLDQSGKPAPVLHRDVTPPNILLDELGVVKLADFGLARAMDRGRMTRADVVKGKVSYLAPELVHGHSPSVQSDLFAVGIVLWEALTMQRLFGAENDVAAALLVRDARVPLIGMKRANVPLTLARVVHRALERDPARRFASAGEMLEAMRELLRVLPGTTDATRLRESVRRAMAHAR
jgi:eukaryotic-like serine/threonine-protein kinase